MEAQLSNLNISALRIEAVSPADIDPELVDRYTHRRHLEHVRITELSCTLSHHAALNAFLLSGEDHGLILEDDVVLASSVKKLISGPLDGFDILRLETHLDPQHHFKRKTRSLGSFTLYHIASRCAGTAAYIVTRHAARAILDAEASRSRSYDFVLFFPFRNPGKNLQVMQIIPALAAQDETLKPSAYQGDIQHHDGNTTTKPSHLIIPHAIFHFWLTDLHINTVKTINRLLGRTRREVVLMEIE